MLSQNLDVSRLKKIKYSVVFNRKNELRADGKGLIQIRAYQNRKNCYFSTDIAVFPRYWDERNKCVKSSHKASRAYNKKIRDLLGILEDYEYKLIQRQGYCNVSELRGYNSAEPERLTFTDFYRQEMALSTIKADSLKNQRTTFNKMCAFRPVVHFHDLTYLFVTDFDRFLKKEDLGLNTIAKHHRNLKKYIHLAEKKAFFLSAKNPYKLFKPAQEEPERVYLTDLELTTLENMKLTGENKRLEKFRDFLLICCWTGLRFGDVKKLCPAHIIQTNKGLQLQIRAEKTKKFLNLPLYNLFKVEGQASKVEQLVLRLLDEREKVTGGHSGFEKIPFFDVSNQYLNRSLKSIAELAGIKKRLTSHVGRRTFATILATKVQMPVLQRLLQHSTLDMTKIYVQLSNQVIENELDKIKW